MDDPNDVPAFDHAFEERYMSDEDEQYIPPAAHDGQDFPLTPNELKRLILACTQILSRVLENEGLPVEKWLEGLIDDLNREVYDDLIFDVIVNCQRSRVLDSAETKLAFTYLKRSLLIIADQIVRERNRNVLFRCWRRIQNYCSTVVPVVMGNATLSALTILAGIGLGSRALRNF